LGLIAPLLKIAAGDAVDSGWGTSRKKAKRKSQNAKVIAHIYEGLL
jgi:hypothetical protein